MTTSPNHHAENPYQKTVFKVERRRSCRRRKSSREGDVRNPTFSVDSWRMKIAKLQTKNKRVRTPAVPSGNQDQITEIALAFVLQRAGLGLT